MGMLVAAAAGLVPTHKAAGEAARVPLLQLGVINAFSKIEPNHRAARAMSLRLSFIAKRDQWRRGRIGRAARDDQSGQQYLARRKICMDDVTFSFIANSFWAKPIKVHLWRRRNPP